MVKLALERKRRGWSLTTVCQKTGIDPATISRLERGLFPPYPGWKERLAQAFGMPADELFQKVEDCSPAAASGV